MNSAEIWENSLQIIQKEVGQSVFELWFSPINMVGLDNGTLRLEVPNRFFKEWIEDYHPTLISESLRTVTGREHSVSYKVAAKEDAKLKREDARLQNRKEKLARKGIYLNPRYTFGTYVVGPSNQFAQAAAIKAAESPGKSYNPFFIYGGVGLGKTHLVTAVGNHAIDSEPGLNVLYVTSEQFTNEVVSAFRHGKTEELKHKYRSLDMLLIDDVQFLENKTATQEELFHTLNDLYERQKQIVLSSDRPPKEIRQVTDRLRSRFSMGLIADIQAPEVETKIAIILKKADAERMMLPEDVINYIATRVKSNVRDIEGCLIRLGAHSSLTGAPVTLSMARAVLKDFIVDEDKPLTLEYIMKEVADYFGIRVMDMKAKSRKKSIAVPRQVAMYIAREVTDNSLSEIGKHMGGKDHATVIYAAKQVADRRTKDESFDRMVDNLLNRIKPS